jgi:hypothetical protein
MNEEQEQTKNEISNNGASNTQKESEPPNEEKSKEAVDPDQIYQRLKIRKPPKTFTTSPPPPSPTTIIPAEEYKKAADSYKKSSDTYKWIAIGLGIFIMYQFYRDN